MSTDLVNKANEVKTVTIQELIERTAPELEKALPNAMSSERLTRIALTCIRTNPKLALCSPESLLGALFTSAQLGVEPIAGHAYLLPFNNSKKVGNEWRKVLECQFILGYRGVASLFYRHAKSVVLSWGVVHENDFFEYEKGTENFLRHRPTQDEKGKVLGFWVLAELANGGKSFEYMTHTDCMEHGRQHSKTFDKSKKVFYDNSPWVTSPESMCLKTCLLKLSKILPISIELQQMIQSDETSKHYRKGANMLEIPDQTNWQDETDDLNKSIAEAKGE